MAYGYAVIMAVAIFSWLFVILATAQEGTDE